MTTIHLPYTAARPAPAAGVATPAVRLALAPDLAGLQAEWRAFEAEAAGTPYQRLDWIAAAAGTLVSEADLRIVVGRDVTGALALVLPLALRRRGPLVVAGPVGGRHANFHGGLWRPGAAFGDPGTLLREAGRLAGADALALPCVPRRWDEAANPLAPAGAPAATDPAPALRLEATAEETLKRATSKDARKQLRQKEKGLAELGPVALRRASTPDEIEALLAALEAQKAERRRTTGLPNPLDAPELGAFLRRACLVGLEGGASPVELYGLMAGERPAAILAAAADGRRLSGMLISFEAADPAVARRSPGDILIGHVIAEQCRRGRAVLDLGIGAARYKDRFCDGAEDLAEVLVPVTALGHAYAAASRGASRLRRRVKESPWAFALLRRLRRGRAAIEG